MRKITKRDDLMSKFEYHQKFNVSRVTIDKKIDSGELPVEEISGKHYIKIK